MSSIFSWLDTHLLKIRQLAIAAKEDPGWADSDFDHRPTTEFNDYYQSLVELRTWIEALPTPKGWLEVAEWCNKNDDIFGGVDVFLSVDWNEEKYSVNKYLLDEMYRRITLRAIRPQDEKLWTDSRVVNIISSTDWLKPPFRDEDAKLLLLIHFLGVSGLPARKILTEEQLAKIAFLDEKRKYITVFSMVVEVDQKYVSLKVDFEHSLPPGTKSGFEVSIYDGKRVGRGIYELNFTIHSMGKNEPFKVSSSLAGGKIEKGENWIKIYRLRGGRKPWDIKPGTQLVLHLSTFCGTRIKKQKLGKSWFSTPGSAYYCATCLAP